MPCQEHETTWKIRYLWICTRRADLGRARGGLLASFAGWPARVGSNLPRPWRPKRDSGRATGQWLTFHIRPGRVRILGVAMWIFLPGRKPYCASGPYGTKAEPEKSTGGGGLTARYVLLWGPRRSERGGNRSGGLSRLRTHLATQRRSIARFGAWRARMCLSRRSDPPSGRMGPQAPSRRARPR